MAGVPWCDGRWRESSLRGTAGSSICKTGCPYLDWRELGSQLKSDRALYTKIRLTG